MLAAMALLSDAQIEQHLQGGAWRREGQSIVRDLSVDDFAAAIELVDRVAELAEAANHHPDILVHGWSSPRTRRAVSPTPISSWPVRSTLLPDPLPAGRASDQSPC
jgi:4a-hydroxytetrahydrobiopterin dehydratase